VVSFTPRPLYPEGKSPWYPLDRRLGGPRAVLDAVVKRKIPSSRRESNPRTPIVQPRSPALNRLSYHGSMDTKCSNIHEYHPCSHRNNQTLQNINQEDGSRLIYENLGFLVSFSLPSKIHWLPPHERGSTNHFTFSVTENYIYRCFIFFGGGGSITFTLKIATAVFGETLEHLQKATLLKPES
jgi:hypothetical protein